MTAVLGERAIVVGGGIGGLFSARVLSEHFEEVVVVDRDSEPRGPHARSMVPQGNHFHILLSGGLDAMCHWFPGFVDDLIETGSVETQFGRDVYWYTPLGKSYNNQRHVPEPVDGDTTYVQTRPQLEWNIRRRVESVANIEFRYDTLVEGPLVSDDRIIGVTVRDADPMNADLVVDASGRNSVTARWLPDLGFEAAPETYVNCDVTYASAICRPTDPDAFDGSVLFVRPDTEGDHPSRTGAISKLPNGEWMVLLGGRYGDFPSTDWDQFREFGRTLLHPIWDQLVDTVEEPGEIKTYRMTRAVRHHYEQLDRFPNGLLPIADAVCFFNPTHGQGMSAAAGQARGLEQLLADRATQTRGLDDMAMEFFPIAEDWVRGPWVLAAMGDFENPNCTGDFPEADLPDLMLLGQAAESGSEEAMSMVFDIALLRKPLSAIRSLTEA